MTIYKQIWDIDRENGAASVAHVGDSAERIAAADIVLDEQVQSSGRREIDLATRPLFRHVSETLLERPTYAAFRRLLDNYIVNFRSVELDSPEEDQEVTTFLDAIADTKVIDAAYRYVRDELRPGLSTDAFVEEMRRVWFVRFTNFYRGRSTHHCSGFEHVFVGEGRFSPRAGAAETKGEVSGYHSWIKFYLDEVAGRVDYMGHKYDLSGGEGPDDPRVVTLQMLWNHQDFESELVARLFKPKGGFFVGPSPEAEIAMGTVAFFQSSAGFASNDKIPVQLGDDERNFELVIYRNITERGQRGQYIRSFFPMYKGSGSGSSGSSRATMRPVAPAARNPGPVHIVRARPNPLGEGDEVGEWVELHNSSDTDILMEGWELRDREARPLPIGGALRAGETRRFENIRRQSGMALGNRGGLISLHDSTGGLLAAVGYGRSEEGEDVEFART